MVLLSHTQRKAVYLLCLVGVLMVSIHSYFGHVNVLNALPQLPRFGSKGTEVDIKSVLTHIPNGHDHVLWSEHEGTEGTIGPYAVLGTPASFITLDSSSIIDAKTGLALTDPLGAPFNLAVLPLPPGSKWDFVGVARGPTRWRSFIHFYGHEAREQVLVAFGLNMTSQGTLEIVTQAETLDFTMMFKTGCFPTGAWGATFGPEDPRLFYTDAGTPALIFGRFSDVEDSCRGIGVVSDLRSLYGPLGDALHPGEGVRRFHADKMPGEGHDRELLKVDGNDIVEKNWMPFFPGFKFDGVSTVPHISYSLSPAVALQPDHSNARTIWYAKIDKGGSGLDHCLSEHHPTWPAPRLHHGTPFYRATLCERGCVPDIHNTVFITLFHVGLNPRYPKIVAVFNVTSPFLPISVGPIFELNGLRDDIREINYALSLSPVRTHRNAKQERDDPDYLPNHFFLDDDVLITLGHEDISMATSIVPLQELISRQKFCQAAE